MTLDACRAMMDVAVKDYLDHLPRTRLNEPVQYVMQLGGKRMRPALTLLAAGLYLDDVAVAVKPALAMEVFHNFTLLHDDIMDRAPLRRGQPTVHEKWNQNAAILSGDAMLIHAYELICQVPTPLISPLLDLFNRTALEVCEGQQLDMDFESTDAVSHDAYIRMIGLKTSVLLGCSLKTGALVAGAPASDADHLYEAGVDLGIAFQLMDDYLDAFGDAAKVGKMKGGDIVAGKKTYLLIRTLELANGAQLANLKSLLKSDDQVAKVDGVLELYETLGIRKDTEALVNHYHDQALAHIRAVELPDQKKSTLTQLADSLLVRQY
ncbi:MAG: polyprenyl synthetase family protein [Flavobacteriales bacterium]|nr:polyprenyl synthetase family protein [Flavobacteriales bacterium]